jgi:hypothetical protein
MAASGYPDPQVLLDYWDEGIEKPRYDCNAGDTLGKFIVIEIAETFDPEASDEEQLHEAARILSTAIGELRGVRNALHSQEYEE